MAQPYPGGWSRSHVGERDPKLAVLGTLLSLGALLVAAFIGAAICLWLYDPSAGSAASAIHRIAGDITVPFHNVFSVSTFPDPQNRFIADWGLAAFVYLVAGVAAGWVLRRLSWVGGRPVQ